MIAKTMWRTVLSGTAAASALGAAQAQVPADPNAVAANAASASGATAGTAAGTTITNQAQATYTVNGTPATVRSNANTFVVDRKVDFTVVAQSAATQVNLGQTQAVLTFTVTNHTNSAQDFLLDPDQQNLSLGILTGTDDFDVTNMRAFVDANGNGSYDAGDTQTYLDELAPDASKTVFIVADIPNTASASLAHVSLHVIAADGGSAGIKGTALIATSLGAANRDNEVDIVFADNDSDDGFLGDTERNGQARVYAAYQVGTRAVDLSILKTSRIVSDGVDTLNMRALPGAVVEYCLLVRNATPLTPATDVVLTDTLPDHTTYVPGSIRVGGTCLLGGEQQDDDANDAGDGTVFSGSYDLANRTVTATLPTVPGLVALAAVFRVTID